LTPVVRGRTGRRAEWVQWRGTRCHPLQRGTVLVGRGWRRWCLGGRAGGRGRCGCPLSPTLPRKGGGRSAQRCHAPRAGGGGRSCGRSCGAGGPTGGAGAMARIAVPPLATWNGVGRAGLATVVPWWPGWWAGTVRLSPLPNPPPQGGREKRATMPCTPSGRWRAELRAVVRGGGGPMGGAGAMARIAVPPRATWDGGGGRGWRGGFPLSPTLGPLFAAQASKGGGRSAVPPLATWDRGGRHWARSGCAQRHRPMERETRCGVGGLSRRTPAPRSIRFAAQVPLKREGEGAVMPGLARPRCSSWIDHVDLRFSRQSDPRVANRVLSKGIAGDGPRSLTLMGKPIGPAMMES
jgi:hypothetical protein